MSKRIDIAAAKMQVGTRRIAEDEAWYPDIDLMALKGRAGFAHRDGRPYPADKK